MKWTLRRIIALSVTGLVIWGASSAIGDSRGSTAPPPSAQQALTEGTGPTPDAGTDQPADVTSAPADTPPADTPSTTLSATPTPIVKPSTPAGRQAGTALAVLATLPVKGRAPMTGYARGAFGPAWTDDVTALWGHNGCDTRNDILRRDLPDITVKPGTNGCVVLAGSLTEPYSGAPVTFRRGAGTSSLVQIDHVVALADAWQSGAQGWDAKKRQNYANDPLVLVAVDGPLNQQKRASNAASWLPPNRSFRCAYVARQVAIKAKYGLWVTAAERDAITRVLTGCPNEPVTTDAGSPVSTGAAATSAGAPSNPPAPNPPVDSDQPATSSHSSPSSAGLLYKNCTAVRAAGAAPVHVGEPGYSRKLDRDGDGIACE